MRVNVNALRQQVWRTERFYRRFIAYAVSIGCILVHNEVVSDDAQARKLATWWTENLNG